MLVKAERPMPQVLQYPLAAMAEAVVRSCGHAMARFMTALHETRRHEAARTLVHHRHLIETARRHSGDEP